MSIRMFCAFALVTAFLFFAPSGVENTLLYEFTVDDPASFTRTWTGQIPMIKTDEPLFEYACHEGNYGLGNVLAGSRAEEKIIAETGRKK